MNFTLQKPNVLWVLVFIILASLVLGTLGILPPLLAVIGGFVPGVLVLYRFRQMQEQLRDQKRELNALTASSKQLYDQHEARVQQLGTMNKVLALLTETLSPENVLDTVISSASAVSEATAIAVYLFQGESGAEPLLVRSAGLSDTFSDNPPRPLLVLKHDPQQIISDQKVIIEDAGRDPRAVHLRELARREHKNAWVELPLLVVGRALGVIVVYFDEPQSFQDEQIELLRTFTNQAAQAIQNADLYAGTYRALEKRVEQLSALAAIGRELTATLNVEAISTLMLKYAIEATGASAGAIVQLNEKRDKLELTAHEGYPPGTFDNETVLEQGITGNVLRNGQPIRCDDVHEHQAYLRLMPTSRSQLSVPIRRRDDTLGVITLESGEPGLFTDDASDFIEQLANQVVIAIDNARLFQRATEARDRMQAILDTMGEAIILIDRWGNVALANPRVDLINLNSHQIIGQSVNNLLNQPEIRLAECMGFASDHEVRNLIRLLRTPGYPAEPGLVSYTLYNGQREVYIHRQIIQVRDDDGDIVGMLVVFYNETEQHELEKARESFSRMIVHDLRSPLTAVTSSVMLLTELIPPESEFSTVVAKTANASQRAIRKLLNRVDSLLDISRMQSGQLALERESVMLEKLVDNVCAELSPLAYDLGVTLSPRLSDLPLLRVDADKIERVLLNLVDNALKFSPAESEIVIRATADSDSDFVHVEVIDRGPGVPETYRKSIFDTFVQVKEQRKTRRGSGLGLTFCKLAIEAHGGRIWIEDNPQGGSIFAFRVPAVETIDTTQKEGTRLSVRD